MDSVIAGFVCMARNKLTHIGGHCGTRQCVLHHDSFADGTVGNQLALVHIDDVAPQWLPW